jgi:hypothetical protein
MNISNQKMSWSDERNKPAGKSTQKYYCVHPWEGKHVTGKDHRKLGEFSRTFGVSISTDTDKWVYPGSSVHAVYVISGTPAKVDACKTAMNDWLMKCSMMYHDRF